MTCGSFSIRRENSCKSGGFFVMQITHVSEPNGALSKKTSLQQTVLQMWSQIKKKLPHWP